MVLSMPMNGLLARNMQRFVVRVMKARDARVKFTNELLQGVRILKLFAWEDALMRQLNDKREEELVAVRDSQLYSSLFMFVFTATPLVVTAVTFVLYAALHGQLTAAKAFTSLSLFNILRFPLSVVPMMISRVIDLTVVNKRLSKFFNSGLRGTQIVHDGGGAAGAAAAPMAFDGHLTC